MIHTNLSCAVATSIMTDDDVVHKQAAARGVSVPDIDVRVIALERKSMPRDMPVHRVPRPAPRPPISFSARCDWETKRQSFQIIPRGGTIWIIGGGEEGALYGFGEVLECLAGVIWAGIKEQHVIFGPTRPLPTGVQKPSFPYRIRDGSAPHDDFSQAEWLTWLSRNRYNGRVYNAGGWSRLTEKERRAITAIFKARCMHLVVGYHAMDYFMPESEFAKHPEWFGMREGRRVRKGMIELPEAPHLNAEVPIQPCLSNPALLDFIAGRMAVFVRRHPEIEIFSIWPHDGVNNWCQCPACIRKAPYESMYALALNVAHKTPPRVPIELIAYANLLTPPRHRLPASNRIVTMLCPYLRHYKHRIYDQGGPKLVMSTLYPKPDRINPVDDRDYGTLYVQWSRVWKSCRTVPGIFEYGGDHWFDESRRADRQRFMYGPPLAIRFDEARWYRRHGVRYFYMCSTTYKGWPDLLHVLGAIRALWNCDEDPEEFGRRYYAGLVGSKGEALRAVLRKVENSLNAREDPEPALKALDRVLASLTGSTGTSIRSYRVWRRYVSLAWQAHTAARRGKIREAVRVENKVRQWLTRNVKALRDLHNFEQPLSYSRTHAQRLQEWAQKKKAGDYRL